MSASLNKWFGIGNVSTDIEFSYTPSNVAVAKFSLAVDRPFESADGKNADFVPVICWRELAESQNQYNRKGRFCHVEGRWQQRSYEDRDTGKMVYVWELHADNVRFLDSPAAGTNNQGQQGNRGTNQGQQGNSQNGGNNRNNGGNRGNGQQQGNRGNNRGNTGYNNRNSSGNRGGGNGYGNRGYGNRGNGNGQPAYSGRSNNSNTQNFDAPWE